MTGTQSAHAKVRWGLQVSIWAHVRPVSSEERARGLLVALTGSAVSQPWTKLFRDTGAGWELIDVAGPGVPVAEQLRVRAAVDRRDAHETELRTRGDDASDAHVKVLRARAELLDACADLLDEETK